MRKYIYLSLAAAAMLASCSSDEKVDAPDNQSQAIAFRAFANNSSRGDGTENQVTTQNMAQFMLYGYDIDTKTLIIPGVMANNANGTVTYNPTVYWVSGHNYRFFGIGATPGMAGLVDPNLTSATVADPFAWPSFQFNNANADGNDDVVVATAEANPTFGQNSPVCPAPVSLVFNHIMTRIQFAFTTNETSQGAGDAIADPYTLQISNVQFNVGATQDATFTPATWQKGGVDYGWGTWAANANATDYTQAYTGWTAALDQTNPAATFEGLQGYSEAHYFVPFKTGTVSFHAAIMQDGRAQVEKDFTATVTHNDVWHMGQSYRLTLNLNRSNFEMTCPIAFTLEVIDWVDNEPMQGSVNETFTTLTPYN